VVVAVAGFFAAGLAAGGVVEVCAKQIIMLLARRPASGIAFKKDFVCIGIVSLILLVPPSFRI
jgi:hypothetical protein